MKRLDGLWPKVTSFENLLLAYRKARRGKRRKTDVACFGLNLEIELLSLQRELLWGDYQPGGYRLFKIYERKPRIISAASFRDRVVHHAVMNLIEPPLDRAFIHDSYACRKGKGVHAAIDRYQGWAHRHAYALKMDIGTATMIQTLPLLSLRAIECLGLSYVRITLAGTISRSIFHRSTTTYSRRSCAGGLRTGQCFSCST
jgi:hypothetical protein